MIDIQRLMAIDRWLDSCRSASGYSGPVVHWWESCLGYTGAMSDWRYEGIICAYLNMFNGTRDPLWIDKAKRAGNDLVASQLPDGRFANSSFQRGPIPGGTPHEAAVDIGLLRLATCLRELGDSDWSFYSRAARTNVEEYHLKRLFIGEGFVDEPSGRTVVSNKNATIIEALLLGSSLWGSDFSMYIDKAEKAVISSQSRDGHTAGGDIHCGSLPHNIVAGIYTARSASGILRLAQIDPTSERHQYLDSAIRYLRSLVTSSGSQFGMTSIGREIKCPTWISGSGDILRVMIEYSRYRKREIPECDSLAKILIHSQKSNGAFPTAIGFSRLGSEHAWKGPNEFRDIMPVVGWIDKTFRALTLLSFRETGSHDPCEEIAEECYWFGRKCTLRENSRSMFLVNRSGKKLYHYDKGEPVPRVNLLSPL